jgi:hypothetical protein
MGDVLSMAAAAAANAPPVILGFEWQLDLHIFTSVVSLTVNT